MAIARVGERTATAPINAANRLPPKTTQGRPRSNRSDARGISASAHCTRVS